MKRNKLRLMKWPCLVVSVAALVLLSVPSFAALTQKQVRERLQNLKEIPKPVWRERANDVIKNLIDQSIPPIDIPDSANTTINANRIPAATAIGNLKPKPELKKPRSIPPLLPKAVPENSEMGVVASAEQPRLDVSLALPREFAAGGVDTSAVAINLVSNSTTRDLVPCEFKSTQGPIDFVFVCPLLTERSIEIALVGFQPLLFTMEPISKDRSAGDIVVRLRASELISNTIIRLKTSSSAQQEGTKSRSGIDVALGAEWATLLELGNRGLVAKSLSNNSPEMLSACPMPQPIKAADLVTDAGVLEVQLGCDVIFINRAGLPRSAATMAFDICKVNAAAPDLCVISGGRSLSEAKITLNTDSLFRQNPQFQEENLENGLVNLQGLLLFSDQVPIFSGSVIKRIGGADVSLNVKSAVLAQGGSVCPNRLEMADSQNLVLSNFPLKAFACGDVGIRPDRLTLTIFLDTAVNGVLQPEVNLTIPLDSTASSIDIDLASFGGKTTLRFVPEENSKLPDYFSVEVFADLASCKRLDENPISKRSASISRPEVVYDNLLAIGDGSPALKLTDNNRIVLPCGSLLEDVSKSPEGVLILTVPSLRPIGPFSLVILSPSEGLARSGWRNAIQNALFDFVQEKRADGKPQPVDIIEISEGRRLRPIMNGEDFQLLPESGGLTSVRGRFDRVRYDTQVAQPLQDLNLVEENTDQWNISSVLLITDSTEERFRATDMGAIYHWLVQRRVSLNILALGQCDPWLRISENTQVKIRCQNLQKLAKSEPARKKAKISEALNDVMRNRIKQ